MKTAKEEIGKEHKREDLGKGIRGKYYEAYKKGTNLVLLSPDVAAAFSDECYGAPVCRKIGALSVEEAKWQE